MVTVESARIERSAGSKRAEGKWHLSRVGWSGQTLKR